MEIINTIILVVFYAVCNALLTQFLDFTLGDLSTEGHKQGRIFSHIGKWIHDKYHAFESRTDEILITMLSPKKETKKGILDELGIPDKAGNSEIKKDTDVTLPRRINPWKVFICPICFNIWIGIFTGSVLVATSTFGWLFLLPYVLISNYFVRNLYRI